MHLLHPPDLPGLSFGSNWVQKIKTSIYETLRMLFWNMDFNFAHFANFNFPHFKIGEIFGLIWVKIQNGQLHLQILFQVFKRCLFQLWALFLLILCIKEVLGKYWIKLTEWTIRLQNFHNVLVSQIVSRFTFCSFWIQKDFLAYFGKIYVYISRACNWMLIIFFLWSVMVFLNTGF